MEHSDEKLSKTPAQPDVWDLSFRVAKLEKDNAFLMNMLTLAMLVGGYFLARWYSERVGHIPGVLP